MTSRHTVDTITSDALDALYDQLDALYERVTAAEHEADTSVAAAAQLTTLVGKRSEKAEKTAKTQRQRAEIAETELRVLRSGLRANGADPTQIQNLWAQIRLRNRQWREEKQRAERAEAALARVRRLLDSGPIGTCCDHLLRAALGEQPAPAPAATQATGQVKTSPPLPYPREVAEDEAPMREYLRADQHQPKEQP
ncbi:hypothetical protein [Streptomyces sp. IBSBF 2507]|uniref:hypothetical protein n=1 Tax=Streptomyces sp. IBSBF 2507 TaxID=2903530 RepID=UPI00351EEF36